MKNMLSREDIKQVRVIVREEINLNIKINMIDKIEREVAKIDKLNHAVVDLQFQVGNLKEDMSEVKGNTRKILSTIDAFVKKNETLEVEQKAHAVQLDRHQAWIKKADKKLKIGVAK